MDDCYVDLVKYYISFPNFRSASIHYTAVGVKMGVWSCHFCVQKPAMIPYLTQVKASLYGGLQGPI